MRLKNKVAVITGGNSGIGLGIAQEFKKEGAVGTIVGRNQKTLDSSSELLSPNFIGIQTDVTKTEALENIFKRTENEFGKLDILVVNAGGAIGNGTLGSVVNTSEEDYTRMVDLNLKSVFFTVQKALPYLKDGSSIVLIASIATQKAFDGLTVYSAAKAGVRSFARTFSRDLLDRNIRVNVLSPGTIETPLFGKLGLPDEVADQAKEQFADLIPVKRLGQPKDMGRVAVFLASDDSSFLLGEEIVADGGVVNL
ncbi:MAG: SDR family oxidoreductase [Psychroserpens sp.]|uniref:SDR family NAD(P)-dependent oxidoreductase n=1 Tax=Psychroserpens sp. TaxID=2020870 RepID=UPI003002EB61